MTNEQATTIRQADNVVTIEGLLTEMRTFEGKTGDGRDYLSATLTIETAENEQHDVSMFSMRLTGEGKESGIYTSLRTVVDEYKTVKEVGREEADYVKVEEPTGTFSNGELRLNDYVGGDGKLRSFPEISTTFANRISKEEAVPHAKFRVEIMVDSVIPEIKNDEETGRVILNSFIPLYGGRVVPFTFVVNKDGSSYVESNYNKGDTVTVHGDIVNTRKVDEQVIEAAFGEDQVKTTTTYVREFEITGGSEVYDEDSPTAFDPEAIRKAMVEREVYLDGLVEANRNKPKKQGAKTGFDTTASKKAAKPKDISKGDLPF